MGRTFLRYRLSVYGFGNATIALLISSWLTNPASRLASESILNAGHTTYIPSLSTLGLQMATGLAALMFGILFCAKIARSIKARLTVLNMLVNLLGSILLMLGMLLVVYTLTVMVLA